MRKSKMLKTVIGGVLAVSMVLPLGISALASDTNTSDIKDSTSNPTYRKEWRKDKDYRGKGVKPNFTQRQAEFESILEELVQEGTLTNSQVDKVKAFFEENKGKRINLHSEIVDQEILTQAQLDAIQEKIHEKKYDEKQERMQTKLDSLIEKGTITEENAKDILDFVNKKDEERKADFEKIKDMSLEERKAYLEENRPQKSDLVKELVESGIITEEQADELAKEFTGNRKDFKNRGPQDQVKIKEILDQLVEKDTLSEEKATKIQDFINEKQEERKAEYEKTKNMTSEERKAYLEENRPQRSDLLKELVESGILTQEEADELSKVFPQQNNRPKGFRR